MIAELEAPPAPKAFEPARLAIWLGESTQATVAVRIFGGCGSVTRIRVPRPSRDST